MRVINASAAAALLKQRPEKSSGSERDSHHDLCDVGAVLSQLSHQSHMRAVVCGLALYMSVNVILGPSIVKSEFFQVSVLVVLRPHLH